MTADAMIELTVTEPGCAPVRFEPCPAFDADGTGSPVCAACGWLADDHPGDAAVHALPARRPPARSRRLAS